MDKKDMVKILESLSKGGINIAGDYVLEKNVEYEVANVENGGIGIQIIQAGDGNRPEGALEAARTALRGQGGESAAEGSRTAQEGSRTAPEGRDGESPAEGSRTAQEGARIASGGLDEESPADGLETAEEGSRIASDDFVGESAEASRIAQKDFRIASSGLEGQSLAEGLERAENRPRIASQGLEGESLAETSRMAQEGPAIASEGFAGQSCSEAPERAEKGFATASQDTIELDFELASKSPNSSSSNPSSSSSSPNSSSSNSSSSNSSSSSTSSSSSNSSSSPEELFHFVHPTIGEKEGREIHNQVKRLVRRQGIQEICSYLLMLARANEILLPQSVKSAYVELIRMGMPSGEGFKEKTFQKYYKRK